MIHPSIKWRPYHRYPFNKLVNSIFSILPKRKLNSDRSSNLPTNRQDLKPRSPLIHFLAAGSGHLSKLSSLPKTVPFQAPRCSQQSCYVTICKNRCSRNCVAGTKAEKQSREPPMLTAFAKKTQLCAPEGLKQPHRFQAALQKGGVKKKKEKPSALQSTDS